ncbi:MAG: TetR/AcrR family transcriptional regulator C-terminal domain-containing protein [Acutalibacteraceae bacterium]
MKKKENQRITLTKRLLKESLICLMSEKNIQRITVSELCENAGINRSTFYNHYGCPADVLTEIETEVIEELDQLWKKEMLQNDWSLNRRTEALCSYLRDNRDLAKLLFRNSDTDCEFASLLFQASHVQEAYSHVFSDFEDPESRNLLITFLINGTYHMIRQWLLEDIQKTPKEIADMVYHIATQGWEK